MSRLYVANISILLIAASLGVAPAQSIHLPLSVSEPTSQFEPIPITPIIINPIGIAPIVITMVAPFVCHCNANQFYYSNFEMHYSAQEYLDYCVKQGVGNIHQLDSDDNGIACEALPYGAIGKWGQW